MISRTKIKIKSDGQKSAGKYPGFSLLELLMVILILGIISIAVGGIFLNSMKTFEKNKEMQKNLEDGRSAMELMAKTMRMSSYAKAYPSTLATINYLYMYNNSTGQCVSYKFDNTAAVQKLYVAECVPSFDTTTGAPVPPAGSTVCNGLDGSGSYLPCAGGTAYPTYRELAVSNVSGMFANFVATDKTSATKKIGQATIIMTLGTGTSTKQTLQTTVSFRDYQDIIQ